jgi:hypothetical protein
MKKPITVYWSPGTSYWNMLYPEPKTLMKTLINNRSENRGPLSFFNCPSFTNKNNKIYSFAFPMTCGYEWDYSDFDNRYFRPTNPNSPIIGYQELRPPTINNSPQITFNLSYLFFCEESLEATFTPPYFSKPNYTKNASVAPGTMDIGQWFRPYPIEITFWEEKGNIMFENNEPLFYVEFLTDRPVVLKRFMPTDKILEYSNACAQSSSEIESKVPLIDRYKRFNETKMNKLIMKEIKQNLI